MPPKLLSELRWSSFIRSRQILRNRTENTKALQDAAKRIAANQTKSAKAAESAFSHPVNMLPVFGYIKSLTVVVIVMPFDNAVNDVTVPSVW
jgi:hypothetical protein